MRDCGAKQRQARTIPHDFDTSFITSLRYNRLKELYNQMSYKVKNYLDIFSEFLTTTIICSGVVLVIYLLTGQILAVTGDSMTPTVLNNEHLFTEKISPKIKPFTRGEIVVFKHPEDLDKLIIKRIIGTPNDFVKISQGKVYINRVPIQEPYLAPNTVTEGGNFFKANEEYLLPSGMYFVLGDNRGESTDSREWGYLPEEDLLGRPIFVYKPLDKFRLLLGH